VGGNANRRAVHFRTLRIEKLKNPLFRCGCHLPVSDRHLETELNSIPFRRSPASTTSCLTRLRSSRLSNIWEWLIPVFALIRFVSLQAWPVTLHPPLRRCRWVGECQWVASEIVEVLGAVKESDESAGDGHGGAHLASGPTARSESSRVLVSGDAHGGHGNPRSHLW